jgi:ABC-type Fe3+/spermidine/putrescine transport system ATPase subunit
MTGVPPNKRDVNMVFQGYALFPHMAVQDNVAFGLPREGVTRGETSRRVDETGTTWVHVTHDQGEALRVSDRIADMNDGIVGRLRSPGEISEHPRTRFVAGFIGTFNLLTGTLARVTGARAVTEISPDEGLRSSYERAR